jgi:hypothetical protein
VLHTPLGLAVYIALILNIVLASVRAVREKISRPAPTPEGIRMMDIHLEFKPRGDVSGELLPSLLKKTGISPFLEDNATYGSKGRLSFLPGTVMRAGLVVFMVSVLVSAHYRQTAESVFHAGETKNMLGRQVGLALLKVDLVDNFLMFGDKGPFSLKGVTAKLISSDREFSATGGLPSEFDGLYWRITHMGYAQRVRAGDSDVTIDLDVLPPGGSHTVELPSGEGPLLFALEPERTIKKGLLTGKIYNLRAPGYRVSVKQDDSVESAVLRDNESARIAGLQVRLDGGSLYVKVMSVSDPALVWMYAGILLGLAGAVFMPSRFFWFEKRICAVVEGDTVLLGYSEEFFRKWGILKFRRWTGPDGPLYPHIATSGDEPQASE